MESSLGISFSIIKFKNAGRKNLSSTSRWCLLIGSRCLVKVTAKRYFSFAGAAEISSINFIISRKKAHPFA